MDVLKSNFAKVKEEIEDLLRECIFVAIDFEMTGVSLGDKLMRHNYAELIQERYARMVPVVNKYSIVQMGICIMSRSRRKSEESQESLVARPYNIFTIPEQGADIALSISALNFLREQGMDFGAWLSHGVSYVDGPTEATLRKRLDEEREYDKHPPPATTRMVISRPNDRTFLQTQLELLQQWHERKALQGSTSVEDSRELLLQKCNPFLRRALFETIELDYPDLVAESRNGQVVVLRLTQADKDARAAKKEADRLKKYNRNVGVRQLFTSLCAAKVPIVVHHGLFDLMFMFRSFHGPLPESFTAFKAQVQQCFPLVYDTKLISARDDLLRQAFTETHVEGLFNALVVEPKWQGVQLAKGFEKYAQTGQASKSFAHEGGYDAYMTGCIFARMRDIMGDDGCKAIANRIYAFRCLYEINLAGQDNLWTKGHLVHVGLTPAAKRVKTDDLMKMFGPDSIHTVIYWCDDSQAFAQVNTADKTIHQLLDAAVPLDGTALTPFDDWVALKRNGTHASEQSSTLAWLLSRTLDIIGWRDNPQNGKKRLRGQ